MFIFDTRSMKRKIFMHWILTSIEHDVPYLLVFPKDEHEIRSDDEYLLESQDEIEDNGNVVRCISPNIYFMFSIWWINYVEEDYIPFCQVKCLMTCRVLPGRC